MDDPPDRQYPMTCSSASPLPPDLASPPKSPLFPTQIDWQAWQADNTTASSSKDQVTGRETKGAASSPASSQLARLPACLRAYLTSVPTNLPGPEGARWMRGAPNSPDHNGPIHRPQDARGTKGKKQRERDMPRGSIAPRHRVGPVGEDLGFRKGQRVSRLFWPDGSHQPNALAPPGTGSEVSGSPLPLAD